MRRPGFLGATSYWFGNVMSPRRKNKTSTRLFGLGSNPCVVCTGNSCTNICSKEQQLSKTKAQHAKLRAVAAATPLMSMPKNMATSPKFALRAGESQNQRLNRLKAAKLYVPGSKMSTDYANLVNWGTTNKQTISRLKQQMKSKVEAQNIARYQTTDIKKIVEMEKARQRNLLN